MFVVRAALKYLKSLGYQKKKKPVSSGKQKEGGTESEHK